MPAGISGHVLLLSKVSLERSSVWRSNSNKRKTAVEKYGGKREKLFFPKLRKEQPKIGWFWSRKKSRAHQITEFFDV